MKQTKTKQRTQTEKKSNGDLTDLLNSFAAHSEDAAPTDLQTVAPSSDSPPSKQTAETSNQTNEKTNGKREIGQTVKDFFDKCESREYHPPDFQTDVPVDSLEASVGYSSLLRQLHNAFVRRVAYHRSDAGGRLSIEDARREAFHPFADREEALKELDVMMRLPVDCLNFIDLQKLYDAAPRTAEGFWELVKCEARAEFESGHLAANITFPEGYMKQVWNIARYLGVRESFADEWQPQGGIEAAMIDMLAQSWFQWQYWLEQTVKRSETRERELHPEYAKWLTHRERELEAHGWTDGYWNRPYVSEQQAIEHAVQTADRFNRIFMRTLRQLRDLRRYSPVTINNPSQVNIAADGGQQVNINEVAKQ